MARIRDNTSTEEVFARRTTECPRKTLGSDEESAYMISRGRHQKKEVADVLNDAEQAGLTIVVSHSGHRWGELRCDACDSSREIWSTPRNPSVHAKQLQRFVARHLHR